MLCAKGSVACDGAGGTQPHTTPPRDRIGLCRALGGQRQQARFDSTSREVWAGGKAACKAVRLRIISRGCCGGLAMRSEQQMDAERRAVAALGMRSRAQRWPLTRPQLPAAGAQSSLGQWRERERECGLSCGFKHMIMRTSAGRDAPIHGNFAKALSCAATNTRPVTVSPVVMCGCSPVIWSDTDHTMAWPGGVRARRGMRPFHRAPMPARRGHGAGGAGGALKHVHGVHAVSC